MKKHFLFLIVLVLAACRHDITPDVEKPEQPGIFPDYADATIPPNIAPLTFRTLTDATDGEARYSVGGKTITARLTDDGFRPELEAWHELLAHAKGQDISVEVLTCENGEMPQNRFCTLLDISKGTAARTLAKLEEQGYVRREENEADGRSVVVYPTEKARAVYPRLKEAGDAWVGRMTQGMSAEEKAAFLELLRRVSGNISVWF